ncbi:FAD-linked oxidase C-terminal domain-containing protein [Nocardioides endophyticus]|uniref:FAD-linked oxidase C-terminal domain-containing protein n=1 Tax=Nocardioides endophyticus TaxID=1353775 RepID=A0ABP8Z9H5_9ACTN
MTDLGDVLARLPHEIVVTDPELIASYIRDESRFTEHAPPGAVVAPRSTAEVAATLSLTHEVGVPVVTRGAGSGLSGGANGLAGCLLLTTKRLNRILEVDPVERILVTQPGVVTADVRATAAGAGLMYPPDPGSVAMSTIGGNVATNAGGMCCVKYGVTGDYVLGLEVVLADGRILRTGRRTMKGVAGYDLTHLFVGSEGTLGVITEATLRLVPAPRDPHTVLATFGDLTAAGRAIDGISTSRVTPSVFELLDETTIRAVEDRSPLGFDLTVGAVLLLQSDSLNAAADAAELSEICSRSGALEVAVSEDRDEARALLEARRLALPALERLGDWLLDDVCVPRSRIVELLRGIERTAAEERLTIGVFGHAGDGNMHPTIIFDAADHASSAAAHRAFDAITATALRLGGTVTGEHGIGRLKTKWLERELGPVGLDAHQTVKEAFDPRWLLNPGVVLARRGPRRSP